MVITRVAVLHRLLFARRIRLVDDATSFLVIRWDSERLGGLQRLVCGAVVAAVLLGCSRTHSPPRKAHSDHAAPTSVLLGTKPATTTSSSTRDVSDEAEGRCVRASSLVDLEWVESVDPSECVYDGDRLAASLACERRGRRERCGDYWRAGSTRLYEVHTARFALESPPQWVRDIEAPHPPCHHGDGQPFVERFVVWGAEPDLIPVMINREKVSCDWRHGQTVDKDVPTSEAVWTDFGKPKDIMCWPTCPEWVWRQHDTIVVRPDNRGVHLVAYQATLGAAR